MVSVFSCMAGCLGNTNLQHSCNCFSSRHPSSQHGQHVELLEPCWTLHWHTGSEWKHDFQQLSPFMQYCGVENLAQSMHYGPSMQSYICHPAGEYFLSQHNGNKWSDQKLGTQVVPYVFVQLSNISMAKLLPVIEASLVVRCCATPLHCGFIPNAALWSCTT